MIEVPSDFSLRAGPIRVEGRRLIDAQGRQIILRGVNFSGRHKQPPHVSVDAPEQLDPLAEAGFNLIRLVTTWEALEPERGRIDDAYLERLSQLCRWAGARGVHVIFDMHQDIYARMFGGSGAPAWTIPLDLMPSEPEPNYNWFLRYGTDDGVRKCLARFWNNEDGIRDCFVNALAQGAKRLASQPEVIGFEIYNEPFPGEMDVDSFETAVLQPFYEQATAATRRHAPEWIAFVEGV